MDANELCPVYQMWYTRQANVKDVFLSRDITYGKETCHLKGLSDFNLRTAND